MFLPIGAKLIPIARLSPTILISSTSTGDLLLFSLIFLEEYNALLNELFVVIVVVVYP